MATRDSNPADLSQKRLHNLREEPRVKRLCSVLGSDAQLHLVGGTVRDALLDIPCQDLDLASRLLPAEISDRLEAADIRIIPTGLKHQTVTTVPIAGQGGVEITTFRGPHISPEGGVKAVDSIEEDLHYRDFTINALAFDLETGSLIDCTGGIDDLRDKIVRAVGDPADRYAEDPLRILRMIRFACQDDFVLEEHTKLASMEFARCIPEISVERVRDEFSKVILSENPSRGVSLLHELGFLEHFLPEIEAFYDFEQNEYHYLDLFNHTLEVVEKTPSDLVLRLSALFHDVGKPVTLSVDEQGVRHFFRHECIGTDMTRDILERLRYPRSLTEQVATLVSTHMRPLTAGPGGLRRLLRDTGELFPLWRKLKEADTTSINVDQEEVRKELDAFDQGIEEVKKGPQVSPLKSLAVNGNDLLSLGIPEGPEVGRVLRALHERVLDDPELNERETLLELAREMHEDSGTDAN